MIPIVDTLPRSAAQGSNWPGLSHSLRKAVPHIEKPQGAGDGGIKWSKKARPLKNKYKTLCVKQATLINISA